MKNKTTYEENNDFDDLLGLGECYEELNNIISNTKDRGVVNVSEILCEVDFLREATHRNTKKAMSYASFKKHQIKLKKLSKKYPDIIKIVGNRKLLKAKRNNKNKKVYTKYGKKALRRELKNINYDISSGSFYKNIRGRIRGNNTDLYATGRHANLRCRNFLVAGAVIPLV